MNHVERMLKLKLIFDVFFLDCLHVDVIVHRNNFKESCQSKNIELFNHLPTVQTRINVDWPFPLQDG